MPRRSDTRLTDRLVKQVKRPSSGRREYYDAGLPGFALRVSETGRKSWIVFYQHGGRNRRYTIGPYPAISLAEARKRAHAVFAQAAEGRDPAAEKKAAKSPDLLEQVIAEFIERYAKAHQPRSWSETKRILDHAVAVKWGKRPIGSITRREIIELLDQIADRGAPVMANRTLAALRKLFNWSIARDIISASPCHLVQAPIKETRRDRVLSEDEIRAFWSACEALRYPFGPLFKLLLVTAQRREEVASMRWSDLDLQKAMWMLPREFTKADRAHIVPLSTAAIDIIENIPETGEYVFTTVGNRPVSGFSKAKARLVQQTSLVGFRLHDLRRTASTLMRPLGVDRLTVSRILNHADGGVTAVYDRHTYDQEKCHALNAWSQKLKSIVEGTGENIVPLRTPRV